ncbi:MAG: TIGR04283 family arsenosugar biosynthesis glycosyltransferase [Bacteriovoracia bacterium]
MISVIIPVLNERENLVRHIPLLLSAPFVEEVIIADGGSTDGSDKVAASLGVTVVSSPPGRSIQMNSGATVAKGKILYFLHADTIPPVCFSQRILEAYSRKEKAGCFSLKFDHSHWLLNLSSSVTRWKLDCFRFGDQSLFVTRELFEEIGGFDEGRLIMEDQHLIRKIKKYSEFTLLPGNVVTSSRRYLGYGVIRTQLKFFLVYLHSFFFSATRNFSFYRRLFR